MRPPIKPGVTGIFVPVAGLASKCKGLLDFTLSGQVCLVASGLSVLLLPKIATC